MNDREKADGNSSGHGNHTLMSVGQNDTEYYEEVAKAVNNAKNKKQNN